jgi:3-oxoacyl-[acyl-carrier-protein] synthase III
MRVIVTPPLNEAPVSLIDVSTYLPGEPIGADYYAQFAGSDELRENLMFRAPTFRHHVGPDETAIDMVERAAQGLIERHGRDVIENVDVLITHTQLPDMPFYGGGGGDGASARHAPELGA